MQNEEEESALPKDNNTWLVVYYKSNDDKDTDLIKNPADLEKELKNAEMGCVPDFWINSEDLYVKLPPVKTDRQLNAASLQRLAIQEDWNTYPILKIRWDTSESTLLFTDKKSHGR